MPANALLILPDFALMMFGFVLSRFFSYERPFWTQAEKLVYFVLFPPLLFGAISGADFSIVSEAKVLAAAAAAFACAVALGFAARWLLRLSGDVFAPVVQTAFRYNSYVGLALAQSLLGARGVALMALIVAVLVPLANVLAVTALARSRAAGTRGGVLRELAVNPLIIATVGGLAMNLAGLKPPAPLANVFSKLGAAGLAIGLLCIGAGLTVAAIGAHRRAVVYFTAVKLLAFPACAFAFIRLLDLHGVEAQLVLLFAALPTASTGYVLAARMGANAAPVAVLITVQTCLSMLTLPLWVSAPAVLR